MNKILSYIIKNSIRLAQFLQHIIVNISLVEIEENDKALYTLHYSFSNAKDINKCILIKTIFGSIRLVDIIIDNE